MQFSSFQGPLSVESVADPSCADDGVIVGVAATGLCRSDWHAWMGHDPGVALPHVPGHELAGTILAVGSGVRNWRVGDRVTVPFVLGCGHCEPCNNGDSQICDDEVQPGFTQWGSFAEFVSIPRADLNLVRVPDEMSFPTAASLGCRFATAYRAIVIHGRPQPGHWVAVHGCGGVGLSAIMIAASVGARVVGIDVSPEALAAATDAGAMQVISASTADVPAAVRAITNGGAHVSIDAVGSAITCSNSVASLRKRGRHVQVGLMVGDYARPPIPMDLVISRELELRGSHGMAANNYPAMMADVASGALHPDRLVARVISLDDAPAALRAMGEAPTTTTTTLRVSGAQATATTAGTVGMTVIVP